ncbi:MAG TPA: hypothetical protein VK933_13500 [Longimicrobiales bacterium]|nr:hypothetical protein [Longimicrobiales bacterium]
MTTTRHLAAGLPAPGSRMLLLVVFCASAAACEDRDSARNPSPDLDSAAVAADADSAPRDTLQAIESLDTPAPPPPPTARATLALDGDGLRIFLVPSGSARPIPFGTPKSDAMAMLLSVLAVAPREQGHSEDCGVDYATWENGLTVRFSRGSFAGWSVGAGSTLTTASGLGIGSSRTDLEAAYVADIGRSTLGIEFTAGGLAGILDSEAPDARVQHLWAGVACLGR